MLIKQVHVGLLLTHLNNFSIVWLYERYHRFHASNSSWCLSIKLMDEFIEKYMNEMPSITYTHTSTRLIIEKVSQVKEWHRRGQMSFMLEVTEFPQTIYSRNRQKKTVPELRICLVFAFHHFIDNYVFRNKKIHPQLHPHSLCWIHSPAVSPKYEFKLYLPGGVPCCFCCSLLLESRTIEMRLIFQTKSRR